MSFTKLLCTTAVGDYEYFESTREIQRANKPVTMYVVYTEEAGIYEGLDIDSNIKQFVVWTEDIIDMGSRATKKENAGDAVAFVRLQFDSIEQQEDITGKIKQLIKPIIGPEEK